MDITFHALMAFLLLGALVALEVKDLLSSVIAVGAVGLGLSILFLLLGAPDIAITQVVVEVITVTVLIRATARAPAAEAPKRTDKGSAVAGVLAVLLLLGFLAVAVASLPPFGDPRMSVSRWYLVNGPELTGATNLVMAILLDFRAYDTLGEATVILASILGVLLVLRRPAREAPARRREAAREPARRRRAPAAEEVLRE